MNSEQWWAEQNALIAKVAKWWIEEDVSIATTTIGDIPWLWSKGDLWYQIWPWGEVKFLSHH